MYTQCPHCHTLFRIHPEHLSTAQGRVRCSRCEHIFNATEHLRTSPDPLIEEPEAVQPEQEQDPSRFAAEPETRKADSEGTKPDNQETELPFDVPYGLPAIEPTPEDGLSVAGITGNTRRGAGYRIIGSISILLLFLLALGQLAWLGRDRLLEYPQARTVLQQICQLAKCKLPVRRDPGEFQVLSRRVGSHPEIKDALLVRLDFSNQASFAQPYPQFLLSLFDNNEVLAARRLFTPEEYLGHPQSGHSLLQPGRKVSVEMGLDDPGDTITGFKFDFR